jgi:Spirocyclase AveC-like
VEVSTAPRTERAPVPGDTLRGPVAQPVEARTTKPIKFWALIGCGIWAFQIFVLIKWVTGPFFTEVDPGPTALPTEMKVAIVSYLVIQWCLFAYLGYRWIIKPLRTERRIGFDGLLFIAWAGFFWMWDPMGNALSPTFTYNAWIPNMGSWVNEIPGWITPGAPGAQAPEPWLFTAGAYSVFFVAMPILGCWVMRKCRQRWPRMGTIGLLAIVYLLVALLETIVEGFLWMRIGLYTYAGTPDLLDLFPGHYYKYPIVESFMWGAVLTGVTYLRWSINDRGESIAERGASTIRVATGPKTGLRLMAIVGFMYTMIIGLYWLPYWTVWGAHSSDFPMDIQKRSYLMNGLCGPETERACPDENVPLFREKSVTVTPDGRVAVPEGVSPPDGPTTFEEAAARQRGEQ